MRTWCVSVVAASLALTVGCGPPGGFAVAPTTGRVVCEGKPVPHVMVFFEPLQSGEAALAGKQGLAIAREDGTFSVSTYGEEDGAVIGKHRVRVGPPRANDHPGYKCACVLNSEIDVLQVEVKKGETNNFELVLKKRTASDPPPQVED